MCPTTSDCPDYEELKNLAQELGRPAESMCALDVKNDPFYIGTTRQKAAHWFHRLWQELGLTAGSHIRRVHYRLVSIEGSTLFDGRPYENTDMCFKVLCTSGRDARHLGLIPAEFIVDRRNPNPILYIVDEDAESPEIGTANPKMLKTLFDLSRPQLTRPQLSLIPPVIPQRYAIEIWCEKSTINDILLPLGQRYRCNVVTGVGEMSHTRCVELVARVREHGRPTIILYLSDFDPGGVSMPTAVARKIEHLLRKNPGDDHVQLRPIVLSREQCDSYNLPRIPLKETERRGPKFEARHGAGGTELDALEALHPGEIKRILIEEIERYFDPTLAERLARVTTQVKADLARITNMIYSRHADQLLFLDLSRDATAAEVRRLQDRIAELENRLEERARPLFEAISEELDAEGPTVSDYDWPEPKEGDEDPDPLFDSTRGIHGTVGSLPRAPRQARGRQLQAVHVDLSGRRLRQVVSIALSDCEDVFESLSQQKVSRTGACSRPEETGQIAAVIKPSSTSDRLQMNEIEGARRPRGRRPPGRNAAQ
jgi:hypothetical protein